MFKNIKTAIRGTKAGMHEINWNVEVFNDVMSTVTASNGYMVRIVETGRKFFVKEYDISISGTDTGRGCLPNGAGREFEVTYTVHSLFGQKKLMGMLVNKAAIGITNLRKEGGPTYLKVEDATTGDRYVINWTTVSCTKSKYAVLGSFSIDLMKTSFEHPTLVKLQGEMMCECAP